MGTAGLSPALAHSGLQVLVGPLLFTSRRPYRPRTSQQWEEGDVDLCGSASKLKVNHMTD